jgi:hypothetical protein
VRGPLEWQQVVADLGEIEVERDGRAALPPTTPASDPRCQPHPAADVSRSAKHKDRTLITPTCTA